MKTFKEYFNERVTKINIKESYDERRFDLDGYWIIPKMTANGVYNDNILRVERVGFAGHQAYALYNPLKFGMTTKEATDISKKYHGQGLISQAIHNGGIHIAISHGKVRVDINMSSRIDNPKVNEEIKKIVSRHQIIGPWGISGDSDRLGVLIDTKSYVNDLPENLESAKQAFFKRNAV